MPILTPKLIAQSTVAEGTAAAAAAATAEAAEDSVAACCKLAQILNPKQS
jgi:hypothetical protein